MESRQIKAMFLSMSHKKKYKSTQDFNHYSPNKIGREIAKQKENKKYIKHVRHEAPIPHFHR